MSAVLQAGATIGARRKTLERVVGYSDELFGIRGALP
jgi:hypothetical protein